MYNYMLNYIDSCFETVDILSTKENSILYLVRHKETGQLFVFRRFRGMDDVYRRLIGIECKGFSRVYDAACGNGETIVLEEYVEGDTLADILRCCLLEYQKAAQIARQVCDGLWALHSVGAVHRDVKPENIMLCGDRAALIDFDASRIYKSSQSTDTRVLGTVGYAAPEQFGIKQTDGRADIYSLGVTLNIMLTGKHPTHQLASGKAGRIIKKCTQINPENRYKNAALLKAALR